MTDEPQPTAGAASAPPDEDDPRRPPGSPPPDAELTADDLPDDLREAVYLVPFLSLAFGLPDEEVARFVIEEKRPNPVQYDHWSVLRDWGWGEEDVRSAAAEGAAAAVPDVWEAELVDSNDLPRRVWREIDHRVMKALLGSNWREALDGEREEEPPDGVTVLSLDAPLGEDDDRTLGDTEGGGGQQGEADHRLARLRETMREILTEEEWRIMAAVEASVHEVGFRPSGEVNVSDAHRRSGLGCSYDTFKRRLDRIRERLAGAV